ASQRGRNRPGCVGPACMRISERIALSRFAFAQALRGRRGAAFRRLVNLARLFYFRRLLGSFGPISVLLLFDLLLDRRRLRNRFAASGLMAKSISRTCGEKGFAR